MTKIERTIKSIWGVARWPVLIFFGLVATAGYWDDSPVRSVVMGCFFVAVLLLRRFPYVLVGISTVLIVVFLFAGNYGWDTPITFVIIYVAYIASLRCSMIFSSSFIIVLGVAICATILFRFWETANLNWIVGLFTGRFSPPFAFWILGVLNRQREKNAAILAEKAELAGTLERNRIAREMHDIIAHSLSGVIALADGARYSAKKDPQMAVDTLVTISKTTREALVQVRGLLSVLREGEGRDRNAAPGVVEISSLVDDARRNGLEVRVRGLEDISQKLPDLVQFTIYRTIQELLTNMLKYSSTATGEIVAEVHGHDLIIQSRNPAEDSPGEGGFGLVGMRERIQAQGGSLKVIEENGDFVVKAKVAL